MTEMIHMKKIIACAAVLSLLVCLCVSAMAAPFAPSVTIKPSPDVVPVYDDNGDPAVGVVREKDGSIIDYVYGDCLIVTAVADAPTSDRIPEAAKVLLLSVYDKLTSGEMTLPYDKFGADLNADDMVIRDLFDATFVCEEHPDILQPEGVTFEITFKLNVAADEDVFVMTYKNEEWNPIVKAVNNGDGTVTCTFEHLCPISFSVEKADEEAPDVTEPSESTPPETTGPSGGSSDTGDDVGSQLPIWGLIAGVSLVAVIVLTVLYRRSLKKEQE